MIVRMVSTAQTGYFYTTQRLRQGTNLAAVKYDPKGASSLIAMQRISRLLLLQLLAKSRVLFVESRKTAKK